MPTIYAAALNFTGTYAALQPAMQGPPYNAPPRAPVLYIKPSSCRIASGDSVVCPEGVVSLRMGGTLAVIVGRAARRVAEHDALGYIGAYAVANDVSVPEESYFRPAIRQRCRDGFCPLGEMFAARPGFDPDCLAIRIRVNGRTAMEANTRDLRRSVARLLADITDFMTLSRGDVLLVGEPPDAPLAGPGDEVAVDIDGLGAISNRIVPEATV